MIDEVYRYTIIIILGKLYELSICRSNFGHKNSNFNTLSQHKIHLMCEKTFCVHKFGNMYYIQVVFGSQFENDKSYKNIGKQFNYRIFTLLVIIINKNDQYCYIVVPKQYTIRLYNLMQENVSLVNPIHLESTWRDLRER